jgi:hypothetical protein
MRLRHALVLACLVAPFAPAEAPPTARDDDQALEELNKLARAAYQKARERSLARTGPIVLFDADHLVLRYGLVREQARVTPRLYHDLKTIGHVALGLHSLVVDHLDRPLPPDRLFDVRALRDRALKAGAVLPRRGLSPAQLDRHQRIIRQSVAFADSALSSGRASEKGLRAFCAGVRPLLDASASDAAKLQLDGLHRQMMAWKKKLSADEWKRLKVVVMGSAQPRRDHTAVQYFARLLGEKGEGPRIVYAEATFDEARALNVLGNKLVDLRVGADFWGEPLRLERDLIGQAARAYLDELFGKEGR